LEHARQIHYKFALNFLKLVICLFVRFFLTLIPLWHGSRRHRERGQQEEERGRQRQQERTTTFVASPSAQNTIQESGETYLNARNGEKHVYAIQNASNVKMGRA
jgi:hypothetical protein